MSTRQNMNILFLTIGRFESIESHALYPDLLREFRNNGHSVYIVSPLERRLKTKTHCISENGVNLLRVQIGNITKCGIIEKGFSTIQIENQFKKAINKYFNKVKFDLVLYSTPPITLCGVVKYVKQRDNAKTYLLLKDIFPQNAVDLGIMSKNGIKGLLYKYFRNKEKQLYNISDFIGCMSQANVDYILKHNSEISHDNIMVCPNCIDPIKRSFTQVERNQMRDKYGIPRDKLVFVYGGNLGKPQGIPFFLECLKSQKNNSSIFFLIVGDGTEYSKIENFVDIEKQENIKLMKRLPKDDYDQMINACDIGLIFLDHRFTIPNFPSRLLVYMQARLPVLAVTDRNTDIGKVIEEGAFGWWCESNSVHGFELCLKQIHQTNLLEYKEKSWEYLCQFYGVNHIYKNIFAPIIEKDFN